MSRGNYQNSNTVFSRINSKGFFYQSSKTPEDGYEEVKLKDGGVVYHKLASWVRGKLKNITLYEANMRGAVVKNLGIILEDEQGEEGVTIKIRKHFIEEGCAGLGVPAQGLEPGGANAKDDANVADGWPNETRDEDVILITPTPR